MEEHIMEEIKPYSLQEHADEKAFTERSEVKDKSNSSVSPISPISAFKSEEAGFAVSSLELVIHGQTVKSSKWKLSWKWLTSFSYYRNWNSITGAFGAQEHNMEIGHPTDVKHVAHIGLEGLSLCEPSWIEELKVSPDCARRSLQDLGQAMGCNRIDDTLLSAKSLSPGITMIAQNDQSSAPPSPPAKYLDSDMALVKKKLGWLNVSWFLHKSRDS